MKLCKDPCYTVASATLVVAASDSMHKERADYVCDGVDDQVEIQAAVDALPTGGGKIVFAEGQFNINDTITANKPIVWQGSGVNWELGKGTMFCGTPTLEVPMLDFGSGYYFGAIYEIGFETLHTGKIDGIGIDINNSGDVLISHCGFFHMEYDIPLHLGAHGVWVYACDFEDCHYCDNGCINVSSMRNWIQSCHFRGNKNDINCTGDLLWVTNCNFKGTTETFIHILAYRAVVANNTFSYTSNDIIAVVFAGAFDSHRVIGNSFYNPSLLGNVTGIRMALNTKYIVMGNTFKRIEHPITWNIGEENIVTNNPGCLTRKYGISTGTGAQQAIAHGLVKTPTKVNLWNIEDGANPYQSAAADATSIYITAVVNHDYGWEAEVV